MNSTAAMPQQQAGWLDWLAGLLADCCGVAVRCSVCSGALKHYNRAIGRLGGHTLRATSHGALDIAHVAATEQLLRDHHSPPLKDKDGRRVPRLREQLSPRSQQQQERQQQQQAAAAADLAGERAMQLQKHLEAAETLAAEVNRQKPPSSLPAALAMRCCECARRRLSSHCGGGRRQAEVGQVSRGCVQAPVPQSPPRPPLIAIIHPEPTQQQRRRRRRRR
jgi:hypothetical protein